MDFTITCDCGTSLTVSEGSAGTLEQCECGRDVKVPSLRVLRTQAGLSPVAIAPEDAIVAMLATGELPGSQCVQCLSECEDSLPWIAECEKQHQKHTGKYDWILLLFMPWYMLIGFLSLRNREEVTTHGRDLIVPVPLTLCSSCRSGNLAGRAALAMNLFAIVLLFTGIAFFWVRFLWAAIALIASLIVFQIAKAFARRERSARIQLLSSVPLYHDLFKRFPHAAIRLDAKR